MENIAVNSLAQGKKIFLGGMLGVLLIFSWVLGVYAAVTLVSFVSIPGDGNVILLWETATELDNAGFNIHRSDEQNGLYERINPDFLPSRGDGVTGFMYEYRDDNVVNGIDYWYKLESIDYSQGSQFYGPVHAVPGATPTPTQSVAPNSTPTATSDQSGTSSSTPTLNPTSTSIAQSTATSAAPGSTPYPGPGTPTAVPDASEQVTGTAGVGANPEEITATLIPFPTVTIQFPTLVPTSMAGAGQAFDALNIDVETSSVLSIIEFWPLGMLLLIWVIIGVWFLITRRHV
jgi:hypothetical protein